jgi:protein phosphatase
MHPLILYTKTDIGKQRATNEDSVASLLLNTQNFKKKSSCGVLVVADGMGGHDKGEIASDVATKQFVKTVTEVIFKISDKSSTEYRKILENAVNAANKEVWKISKQEPNRIGTTLLAAIIVNDIAYIANIGDSRAYLVRPHKHIQQITKDHSVVQEMLDAKMITRERVKNHPRRNVITRAIGLSEHVVPDIYEQKISNETLILCTDGLYGMIEEDDMVKIVNNNVFKSVDTLISLANKQGGQDNISVAIAKYGK